MRILAVTPTYSVNGKLEIRPETIEGVFKQQLDGHTMDWIVITGKTVDDFDKKTLEQAYAYNRMKILLTDHYEYDAMLTLESDIILERSNVVQIMADFLKNNDEADVATAPHRARPHGVGHSHIVLFSEFYGRAWYRLDMLNEYYKKLKWGAPFRVTGSGLGCVLIRDRVLRRIQFGGTEKVKYGESMVSMGVDTQFFTDCLKLGFKTYCVPTNVGHIDTDGKIYTLDEEFYTELVDRNIGGEFFKKLITGDKT